MKQSFKVTKKDGPAPTAAVEAEVVTPAEESKPETALATRPDQTVSNPLQKADDMTGDFNPEDIRWPRINLIHKTSKQEAIDAFGIGSIVLNQELKLTDGKTPLEVVAVRFVKDYIQKLPFGSEEKPKVCKTEAEVEAAGGSTDWEDRDSGDYFIPRGHVLLLIPMPESLKDTADESLFTHEHDGKAYAVAVITISSSAYTSMGKELSTLRAQNKVMRKGLRYGKLLLTTDSRKNAKFSWMVPVIKFAGENSPELVKFIEETL